MPMASIFTDEQRMEIALDLIAGKLPHAEFCRKWDISSTCSYKHKDRDRKFYVQGLVALQGD